MARKVRYTMREQSSDYNKGFVDGMKTSFEESELDAYYTGVGYGKKSAGDKHLGFNIDDERLQFEAGVRNNKKHFRSYRVEKPSLFERIFCANSLKKERAIGEYKKQRVGRVKKQVNKQRKTRKKKQRRSEKRVARKNNRKSRR